LNDKEIIKCFGKHGTFKKCRSCLYVGSCQYATENQKKTNNKNAVYDQSTRQYIEMDGTDHPNKPSYKPIIPQSINNFLNSTSEKTYTHDEVIGIISIILRFASNKVVAAALADKVSTGDNLSQIAKRMGIHRQYLDRKIADSFAMIFGWRQSRVKDANVLKMSTNEYLVLKYRMKKELTLRETAKKIGITREGVRRIQLRLTKNEPKNKKKLTKKI